MLYANADQKVLGYLGRGLSLELSAIQQYATFARLVAAWGFVDEAGKLKQESIEEMQHVDKLIMRMLALGSAPNSSIVKPVRLGKNLSEILKYSIEMEQDLVSLYSKAVKHCAAIDDYDNRRFFEELLKDEEAHMKDLIQRKRELETIDSNMQDSGVTF